MDANNKLLKSAAESLHRSFDIIAKPTLTAEDIRKAAAAAMVGASKLTSLERQLSGVPEPVVGEAT